MENEFDDIKVQGSTSGYSNAGGLSVIERKQISEILMKDPNAVTPSERDILVARRSYLNAEQKAAFGVTEPKLVDDEDKEPGEKPLDKMNKDELIAKAKSLGLTVEDADTKAKLAEKITAAAK